MNTKRLVAYGALVGGSVFLFIFLVTTTWIGFSVREKCELAKEKYEGGLSAGRQGCTEAMSQYLDDEQNPIGERNHMIWALGQLGEPGALPILEKYYTGDIPDREPWNSVISQYELRKAVKLARGGFNAGALVWRLGW